MKRRSKVMHNMDIFDFQYATNTTREMLDIFLKEKEVYNLSVETLRCYKYHINTFITFLEDKADDPAFKSCTQKTYNAFILYLKDRGTKDVTVNTIARSLRAMRHQISLHYPPIDFEYYYPFIYLHKRKWDFANILEMHFYDSKHSKVRSFQFK